MITFRLLVIAMLFMSAVPAPAFAQTAVGGADFTLTELGERRVRLTWNGGTGQIGYQLSRFSPGPSGNVVLGPEVTEFTDELPAGLPGACYSLITVGPPTVPGSNLVNLKISAWVCSIPGGSYGANPSTLSIRFVEPGLKSLVVSWTPPSEATGVVLVPIGTLRLRLLPGNASTATDTFDFFEPVLLGHSGGCYVLYAFGAGGSFLGASNMVCGILPGAPFGSL